MMIINDIPLRVAITGVTGRMGKELIQCINNRQNFQTDNKIILGAAIAKPQSHVCGMNIGSIYPSNKTGEIVITDNIQLIRENFDILIDFTTPQATIEYLNFCVMYQKNMIIGTTGLNETHLSMIKSASQKIGIVCSANFSIGVTVMLKLLEEASKTIGNFVDVDIIEMHHNKKHDLPSGTALVMRNIIEKNMLKIQSLYKKNNDLGVNKNICQNELLYKSLSKSQNYNNIHVHSIRSGDIIGEHIALFSGLGERLEIIHKASNRSVFANGALYAALWLKDKKIGLFDLSAVLGFDNL